ncbi:MAG: lamin tail domain-containing protein, partial [Saprospiraceae bacterium]|nr:lamin tail domain-containing protein [Saprospiraceae bacterium]
MKRIATQGLHLAGLDVILNSFWLPVFLLLSFAAQAQTSPSTGFSQKSGSAFWKDVPAASLTSESGERLIVPIKSRTLQLDITSMKSLLSSAPAEPALGTTGEGLDISLPTPEGAFKQYKVWYAPIMAPALAAQYPEIRTYAGYEIGNQVSLIRLDVTPKGFHAMTYGDGQSIFIDPYVDGNVELYNCYFKRDFVKNEADRIVCHVDGEDFNIENKETSQAEFIGDCGVRHEYRLAVAGTGEYTTFHGGTVALALAAMNTTMNRVNGVFEKDVAVRMILVANNNLIIYTNAGTDPYTNGDPDLMINENQTNCNAVIGSANYDIGHVFGTNSGGLAGLGVVCSNSNKARGVTGSGAPVGDPFDIDYVAHEMGHQFNANHTQYNDCNRNNSTAIEPGSASTIMGYAGICSPDVQGNSDDYFSTASLYEMRPFVATGSGSTCDVAVSVSNAAPTVTPLSNYSIPASTPFILTATATDPNGTLSYCWEQIDAYTAPIQTMPPAAANTTGPMFRSLDPVVSPTRYFPNLTDLFSNTNPTWEELPSVGRNMNFRVTVRDNFATAGCTGEAANTVTTVAGTGPFLVTSPNTAVTYAGTSSQTVTWDVAGTTAAPISCANVNILLTTDGGATFTTLLANTPNDGTQSVTMPNINTTTARIWVQCSNNIFFDVSNVNFTINAVAAPCAELFISEYVEGSGNNKAIEIYNPTANPILLTGVYSLRMYFNGSITASTTIALTGTIAPYDVFVVADNDSDAAILAQTDQQSTASFYNGDDAIELFNGSTSMVVDVIGQVGFDPGTEWGTGLVSTADNTIRRKSTVQSGDMVGNNAFVPATEWDGFANNTFDGLGSHSSACAPSCVISNIAFGTPGSCNNNGTVGNESDDYFTADITVTFSDAPGTGTLDLSGDVLPGGGALSVSAPFTSPITFSGVRLRADNTASAVTATFSANGACSFSVSNGPTVAACSACPAISATISGNGAFCAEGNLGDVPVLVTITGGAGPYTVVFTDGMSNFTEMNYTSGAAISEPVYATSTYTLVSVTDANGCTAATLSGSAVVQVSSDDIDITSSSLTQPTCAAPNGGAINITVAGGLTPYTFLWSNNATSEDISGLVAGPYTVVIEDAGGCTFTEQFILDAPVGCVSCPVLFTSVTNTTCNLANGAVDLTVAGGTGPFTFAWSNTASTEDISGLAAGTYTVTVTSESCPTPGITTQAIVNNTPDTTPPSITCPAPTTVQCAGAVPPPSGATANDNCTNPTPISSSDTMTNQTCANRFTITRTFKATDAANNTATCSQTITVNDQTPPSATAGTINACYTSVAAAEAAAIAATTASDNCGAPVITASSTAVANCGYTIVVTVTDACSQMASVTYTTKVDGQAPTFNETLPTNNDISCTDPLPVAPMLTASDNCGGGAAPDVIWINELHYDNTGADVGEFVEVAGTAGINLSDYQIVLYNGNGGTVYDTDALVGTIDNEGGSGFGAVNLIYPSNGIQNGAPDGIALYRISTNQVIQFLSFEGSFQAQGGPANGIFSTDIGVLELGTEPLGLSLQLTGSGSVAANFTWTGPVAQSPGTLNVGQTITALPVSIQASFMQTEVPGTCAGSRIVTRTWTATDACGNSAVHTQTINVSDTDVPVFTPAPANITISCSDPAVGAPPTVIATDECDPAGIINGDVWVNEIHYENVGTDENEFLEIAGRAGVDLSQYSIFLYNGSDGATYDDMTLNGVIPNQSNGFGTVSFPYPVNGIQNGAPDGIALVKGPTVIQFLSYEGSFTAIGGPANGMISTDIGVAETGSDPLGLSLRLTGTGTTYANFIWNAPATASAGAINQGQSFPTNNNPIGLTVTFNQTTSVPAPNCPSAYTITRTWTATDACGNTGTHTQIISVVDNTPPTLSCPANITVNLGLNGIATVTSSGIGVTVTDNCGTATITSSTLQVDCEDEGTSVPFTISATDQCANVGTCTVQVFVNPFARCEPEILISDPCVCKNNATTLTNGQFGETIKVESITGLTWTVTSVTGFFSALSPAPPSAPTPITVGTVLTESPVGSGDYFLNGIHVDAIGYSITVSNGLGVTLSISNSCEYPNPVITSNLDNPFCLYSDAVILTGDPGDANIVSQGFTVNGTPATIFDPGAGVGQYIIRYTVDGGVPKAFGPNDP